MRRAKPLLFVIGACALMTSAVDAQATRADSIRTLLDEHRERVRRVVANGQSFTARFTTLRSSDIVYYTDAGPTTVSFSSIDSVLVFRSYAKEGARYGQWTGAAALGAYGFYWWRGVAETTSPRALPGAIIGGAIGFGVGHLLGRFAGSVAGRFVPVFP